MESKLNEDSNYDSFLDEGNEELNFYKGVMTQKLGRKQIYMEREIKNKKKALNRFIYERFGSDFIPIKSESLIAFELGLKEYLFSPSSEFLNHFPRLKRKLLKERKIKEDKLKEKINVGTLLYLSMQRNDKNINDKFFQRSKNLNSTAAKNILTNAVYKARFEKKNKERINKILSYRNIRHSQIHKIKTKTEPNNNNIPELHDEFELDDSNNIKIKNNKKNKNINSYNSRNTVSNIFQYRTTSFNNNTENNSLKVLNPFSTFSNLYSRSHSKYFINHTKSLQKDLNKYMDNLGGQTNLCNDKLIRLIDGNRKKNLRKKEEKNKEIVNLKKIIYDKNRLKPKKKIKNIFQIKSLINKAKEDFEGEFAVKKMKKNELRNFGHYINIMSDDLVLSKVNELFTKNELKKRGRNFTQDEMEKLKRKKEKELIGIHNRLKIKNNYNKMLQLENDLYNIKNKFNNTNLKVMLNTKNNNLDLSQFKKI